MEDLSGNSKPSDFVYREEVRLNLEEERRRRLREFGATNVEGTEGIIPVAPGPTEPEILEYAVRDTTPLRVKIRRLRVDPWVRRAELVWATKFYRTQGLLGLLKKLCTSYKNPKISFEVRPRKVRNVVFHVFSLKFDGDVVCEFVNRSEEGEEGSCAVWIWQHCPPEGSPEYTDWKKVAGSADLVPSWAHNFVEDKTSALLGKIDKALGKVYKGRSVEVTGAWKTKGLWDLAWTILSILVRGSVITRNGFDVTVKYTWLGKTQTISRHIDAKVELPIEGNIRWSWD